MVVISRGKTDEIKERISFLFMTATDIETNTLLKFLTPIDGEDDIMTAYIDSQTYTIGKFGLYNITHVQTAMGSILRDASLNTTNDAILLWKPKSIIMVGIAFGNLNKQQNVGDVIISDSVVPYEPAKIGEDSIIQRGNIVPSGSILLNRFRNLRDWKFILPDNSNAKKHIGKILSGEKLIDNKEFVNRLFESFPEAIGGEMEGAGLYSAASHNNINEWIIIKGICDLADGNKSINKTKKQELAAESAVSICHFLFSIPFILDDIVFENKTDEKKIDLEITTSIYGNNNGIIHSGNGDINF